VHWAIVIGIDAYPEGVDDLTAAVDDAESFYRWVTSTTGANVPKKNVIVLLGRARADRDRIRGERAATKDNIMGAISDVMRASKGAGERLYFYFSGHGLNSTYAGREESALAASDFDGPHNDRSIAVRSITEFFETTQFEDQFFFIDACRNKPTRNELEIGSWSIPRRRDPGQPPVQQFILYATSPGREAKETGWPGEAAGAFTSALMCGLAGKGKAKAWSWEHNCYEVRWERLANYVKDRMTLRRDSSGSEEDQAIQIPQDGGSRGVLDRDRDARLAIVSGRGVPRLSLTLDLKAKPTDGVEVVVLDAIGVPVAREPRVTGPTSTFSLPPRTYAVRATSADGRIGRLSAPVELYEDEDDERKPFTETIEWNKGDVETEGEGDGTIRITSSDPLAVADIRDETGRVVGVAMRTRGCDAARGIYRVRLLGPGPDKTGDEVPVVLRAGARRRVTLKAAAPDAYVSSLAEALGGRSEEDHVIPVADGEPVTWARPSTVVAAGIGAALHDRAALRGFDLESPLATVGERGTGVALYAVASDGDTKALQRIRVRVWSAGTPVPKTARQLEATAGVAAVVTSVEEAKPHWLSIEPEGAKPTVIALPVMSGRLATIVVEADQGRLRLYQFHPVTEAVPSTTAKRLRRLEHLQRLLLGGRLDGALSVVDEVAAAARDDPFAGCLAGYVLLRLGRYEPLEDLASEIVAVAPKLSDAYILRGEYEAYVGNADAMNQAFADAIGAGIPAFGEGLTRLVEGLRASRFLHPRGALVRYIFQQHARGAMWAAFNPRDRFDAGRLVITVADLVYEA
jgi:hypothetical protein